MAHKFPEVINPAERSQIAIDLRHMKRELRSLEKRLNENQDWINRRYQAVQWEIIGYTNAIQHTARARMAASGQPFWTVKAFYNPDYKFGMIEKCFVGPGSYQKATNLYEYLKARPKRYDAVYLRQSKFTRYDTTKLLEEERWETEGFTLRTQANDYDEPWNQDDWEDEEYRIHMMEDE